MATDNISNSEALIHETTVELASHLLHRRAEPPSVDLGFHHGGRIDPPRVILVRNGVVVVVIDEGRVRIIHGA